MEFAKTARAAWQADDSYYSSEENSIVLAFLWISLGAIAGANARYMLSRWAARALNPAFPFGTMLINVTGSFLLGLFMAWTTKRVLVDVRWRLLMAVGFCGGYTTFSSYAFETIAYFQQGQWLLLWTKCCRQQLAVVGGSTRRNSPGKGTVKCQPEWRFRSLSTSTKPTNGTTGRCTWRS
jgi:CrcB protein